MTTRTSTRSSTKARPASRTRRSLAPRTSKKQIIADEPEEGAGSNDERELPEDMRENTGRDKRPPTNSTPDNAQDPSRPSYKEPHPKDRIINTLGYDPTVFPYESPEFIDLSHYDISARQFI